VQLLLFVASYSEVLEVSYGGRGEGGMERGGRTERHGRGVEDEIRSPARPGGLVETRSHLFREYRYASMRGCKYESTKWMHV
jgi:hypothetical protein